MALDQAHREVIDMSDSIIQALQKAGVETDQAVRRFAGNAALYEKFLVKFIGDSTFSQIAPALMGGDYDAALAAAHTLKGVSGNLSMIRLYNACSRMVTLIREGKTDEARSSYEELSQAYKEVYNIILDNGADGHG